MRGLVEGDQRQRTWTDEKTTQKPSAWEVDASAVGPDLAFATATVSKTTRTSGAAPGDDAWETASRTRPAAAPAGR
jgi:single-strand DNA-binding protein